MTGWNGARGTNCDMWQQALFLLYVCFCKSHHVFMILGVIRDALGKAKHVTYS